MKLSARKDGRKGLSINFHALGGQAQLAIAVLHAVELLARASGVGGAALDLPVVARIQRPYSGAAFTSVYVDVACMLVPAVNA